MKKSIKKITYLALSLIMVFTMIPMGASFAFADDTTQPLTTISSQPAVNGAEEQAEGHVCYIDGGRNNIYYTSLEAAINSAKDSWTTIYLLKDISTKNIDIDKADVNFMEINMGDHKITGTSDKGIVFTVKGETSLMIDGDDGCLIKGSIVLKSGSNAYLDLTSVAIENDAYSPVVIEDGALFHTALKAMWTDIKTNSETYPAVTLEANTTAYLWSSKIESKGTGILLRGGTVEFSGCDIVATKKALEISQSAKDYPINVTVSYEHFTGEYTIYEKDTANSTGGDKITITADSFESEGKIYSQNCRNFITGGRYIEDVSEYVDPAYECIALETSPVTYTVQKRAKAKGLKALDVVSNFYGEKYEDHFYYTTFKGVDLKSKLNSIQNEAASNGEGTVTITVDNDVAVEATVQPNVTLKVNNFSDNKIKAELGCTLSYTVKGNTTTYTAEPSPIDEKNVIAVFKETELWGDESLGLTLKGKLTGATTSETQKIIKAVSAQKDYILSNYNYDQYTAMKQLVQDHISVTNADDIKVVVEAYLNTTLASTESMEDGFEKIGIEVVPQYHLYLTTAKDVASMVTTGEVTATKVANATEIDGQLLNEFELKDADGNDLAVTYKILLPKEFCSSLDETISTFYYPNGMWDDRILYFCESKVTKSGSDCYITFEAPAAYGYFKFAKNCQICFTSTKDGKTSGYEYLSSVLSGEAGDAIVYLTDGVKKLTDEQKEMYLTAYLYENCKVTIDKSAAPDTEFNILPLSDGMVYTKSVNGNQETYNVYDLSTLKFKATSALNSKKNIVVTVKPTKESKAVIDELKDAGYTFKYSFYRSTKKASQYKVKGTSKNGKFTNTSGKKGTSYYYKAGVQIFDSEGNLVYTTPLRNCSYAKRTWKK